MPPPIWQVSVFGKMTKSAARVPLVTIGGFLGAGKTTLVNQILKQADGQRIVVFVNDFGAINIDYDLVQARDADRISLKNGCVCCSLNDDLVGAVAGFVKQTAPPDAIVIEASGIADPRALDSSLKMLEAAGVTRSDAKLYVLDAANYQDLDFDDAETIIDHAAVNDIVLLNKADLVPLPARRKIQELLSEAAPFTQVIETINCDVARDMILGAAPSQRATAQRPEPANDHHLSSHHDEKYQSWSCEFDGLLDRQKFEVFAMSLPGKCLRAKGILRFSDTPDSPQVFNLVGYRATLEPKPEASAEERIRLVVIGFAKDFNRVALQTSFAEVIADKSSGAASQNKPDAPS